MTDLTRSIIGGVFFAIVGFALLAMESFVGAGCAAFLGMICLGASRIAVAQDPESTR